MKTVAWMKRGEGRGRGGRERGKEEGEGEGEGGGRGGGEGDRSHKCIIRLRFCSGFKNIA